MLSVALPFHHKPGTIRNFKKAAIFSRFVMVSRLLAAARAMRSRTCAHVIQPLSPPYRFIFLVRDWTRFCYVIGFENIRIHPYTRYRIRCGFSFYTLESGFKNIRIHWRIRWMRVDGRRIRKDKVSDSKISG